jgi:hypothetical protein
VLADEKLTDFMELESAIRACDRIGSTRWQIFGKSALARTQAKQEPSPTPSPNPTPTPFFANIEVEAVPGDVREKSGSVNIPAGKMLVVEFVSASIESGDGIVRVSISDGATGNTHFLVTHSAAGCDCNETVASEQIRMYATSSIVMGFFRITNDGLTRMVASVTGYLVDVP